jgi:hypothetical protein
MGTGGQVREGVTAGGWGVLPGRRVQHLMVSADAGLLAGSCGQTATYSGAELHVDRAARRCPLCMQVQAPRWVCKRLWDLGVWAYESGAYHGIIVADGTPGGKHVPRCHLLALYDDLCGLPDGATKADAVRAISRYG